MSFLIVTNNASVLNHELNNVFINKEDVVHIEGSVEDVLIRVRDLIHEGYELVSHPLAASLKMLKAPYRSVVLGEKSAHVDALSVEIIEDSIFKYRRLNDNRLNRYKFDICVGDDFKMIDRFLLETALHEQQVTV